jgi:apolipoprotein N-acyltransferase
MTCIGWFYVVIAFLETLLCFLGPCALGQVVLTDFPYFLLLFVHLLFGARLLFPARLTLSRQAPTDEGFRFRAEQMLVATLVLFAFAMIYALNANMDYVQRFIASGGAVRLALDTRRERMIAFLRFAPLMILNIVVYLRTRPALRPGSRRFESLLSCWALVWVLLSLLPALAAFPSFLGLAGFAPAAFIALVPLLLVISFTPSRRALFYALSFGVLQGMLLNFWLGTFSLITLQLVTLFFLFSYGLFFGCALWLYRRLHRLRWLVFPLAWTLFEYLRSSGFLGYPWGLWGTTQYSFTPLIQVAALTGVWGVSFLVLLVNAALAEAAGAAIRGQRFRSGPLLASLAVLALCAGGGFVSLAVQDRLPADRNVRVALIQQNSDPRKHDYKQTFATLKKLTDSALRENPDLVVWSETAFVPNIRRWSGYDPERFPLAALVRDFLDYQRDPGMWLVTGNDDYEMVDVPEARKQRRDYNAAILFSPSGERIATYHKIHLVPFTEYFPWKQQLRGFHRLLLSFDVYLWEPGNERVIFEHPRFRFATPICFEDAFPDDVRRFVRAGAEAIVNLSNDYWSLTEVEARQHFANALFRAVENRRPMLRATASGVTAYVDAQGRLRASLPLYREGQLTVDVAFPQKPADTLYTRRGDWFPRLAGALLALLGLGTCVSILRKRL